MPYHHRSPFSRQVPLRKASFFAALCVAGLLPGRAHAQLLERYEPTGIPGYPDWFTDSVQPTQDTGYEPLPVKVGAVQIDPVLSEAVGGDNNVLNSPHKLGSASVETDASVHAGTTWARNAIDLSVTADDMRYLQAAPQSYTDWTASAGGRFDIDEDNATLAFSHANIVSLPTEIGSFGFFQPLRTVIEDGRGSYQVNFGKFSATPSFDIASYTNSGGGDSENQVRRDDRIAYTATLSLAYALSTGTSVVLIGSDTQARFSDTQPGTPVLDYGDASVLAGIDIHPEGVLRYRALVGYEQLDYTKSGLPGVSAPAAELDAVWTPTALTTLTGRVTQSLQNSPGATTGTYTYTAVHARIDQAYLRNLILDASVDYQAGDFTNSHERQSVFSANVGARWQLNRGLALSVNESFQALQSSGGISQSSTRNVVSVQVTIRPGAFD